MEELSTVFSQAWGHFTQNKAVCCCVSLTCLIFVGVWLTFLIYLGIYSFDNPDKDAWLGHVPVKENIKSIQMELYPSEQALKTAGADSQYIHMHARLVAWFTWGFFTHISPFGTIFLVLIGL